MELTWDFDTNVFNGAEEEYVRISIIDRDPRSTFITAEFEIHRRGLSEIDITGASYGGGTTIAATSLNISQSTKFIAVIDADLNNEVYSVHFSDDAGASFTTIGSGIIGLNSGLARKALSTRMTLNNDFSGDNVLIDRIYLATIPEPTSIALVLCGLVGLAVTRRRV
jgi:hypothetical protein